jgi:formylglycine-generating enzyme required for sulfatase activity
MFIEHLLEVPHMEKLLVVKTAKGIIGVIDLVEGVLVSLETSALSGEVLAEATKIKAAQQRYMASKAYVYLFENPDAKTIPPEYVVALLATCSKTPEVNQPAPGTTQIRNSAIDGASMVFVPAGDFLMGSGDADKNARAGEKPQHTVYLDAFWIDKFEVTNALYKKCVDAGKCAKPKEIGSYTRNSYYGNPQFDNHPVIYVSWDNATQYCAWAGKRLPTEAQWEKAARGTDGRIYPWGNVFDKNKLNSSDGGNRDTIAVGNFSSGVSPYGAMDMAGNVWEWVADWYDEKYYANSPRNNPKGPSSGQYRVFRGGSYNNGANDARAVYRNSYNARWYSNMGFRCVE